MEQNPAQHFLSNLSHQIRTPLNGIIGYTQLLSQTKLNKTQESYINSMNICSLQLISLINDILDFSKLATGKAQLKKECFSFKEVIQEINSTLGSRIKEKKQKIHYVLEQNLPDYIISDKLKLSQILINLISNSNKFSPSNSRIIVNINTVSNDTVKFTVEDSGIGISPSDKIKLFNPFVQIQDSLTKNGSGLGLAICKKLVELLGGNISVESVKDNGSIFSFTIKYESYNEFKSFVEKNNGLLKDKIILILNYFTPFR
jgi:signal transduction histidine kinase